MNLIPPPDVVNAIAAKIGTNKTTVGVEDFGAISEDTKSGALRPPYAAVFQDFEKDSDQETGDSVMLAVPVEIKVLCSSSKNQTAALSFAEAFLIATKIITLIKGTLSVTVGAETVEVQILLRKKPFDILMNKADQAIVQVNFYYEIDAVGA